MRRGGVSQAYFFLEREKHMSKYVVNVKEIHINQVTVDAESTEEAIQKIADLDEIPVGDLEYSHTADPVEWTAYKLPSQGAKHIGIGCI